jgi:hypothetical protein
MTVIALMLVLQTVDLALLACGWCCKRGRWSKRLSRAMEPRVHVLFARDRETVALFADVGDILARGVKQSHCKRTQRLRLMAMPRRALADLDCGRTHAGIANCRPCTSSVRLVLQARQMVGETVSSNVAARACLVCTRS